MKLPTPVKRRHSRIEIIPLIDIMFFLLASFMMVSLQSTEATHDFKPNMLNIAVDKSGSIWLEKKQVSLADMALVVSNRFKMDTNLPVFISGDRDTLEGALQEVLEKVRNAGVQKVSFAVGGTEQASTAAPAQGNRP